MENEKPWPLEAEREFWSDVCTPGRHEHSLWWFVNIAAGWRFRCQEKGQLNWLTKREHLPWLDWVQNQVEEWYAHRLSGKPAERRQIIVCVPRGCGKSNIITKPLPLYIHLREPNLTSYIGSEVHPKAKAFLKPMKQIMEGNDPYSWFAWLYGVYYSPERDWNNEEVVTAARESMGITEPTVGTFGVETGMTSKHPLLCIYDDPVSEEKLKEGGSWLIAVLDSLDAIYPALRPDSLFILIGTRYLDDDPIGTVLDQEGVAEWVGHPPLEKTKEGILHVFFLQARDRADVRNFPKGEPVFPEAGWNNEALERYERKNSQEYNAQMMNDPSHGEHMELTPAQINALLIPRPGPNEPGIPIEYATLHFDTAFKDEQRRARGDYNVILVWLHDIRNNGMVYLDSVWADNTARGETFDMKMIEIMYGLRRRGIRVRAITDEAEQGGKRGVYRQHIEQVLIGAGLRIPEIYQFNRSGTRKDLRIREAAGYWIDNYVRIFDDVAHFDELKRQMTRIGRSKYDDIADAAADVFRPEVWHGRSSYDYDVQPPIPIQPGDEVLKEMQAQDTQRLRDQITRQLYPEQHQAFEDLFPNDEQPGESGAYGFADQYQPRGPW